MNADPPVTASTFSLWRFPRGARGGLVKHPVRLGCFGTRESASRHLELCSEAGRYLILEGAEFSRGRGRTIETKTIPRDAEPTHTAKEGAP